MPLKWKCTVIVVSQRINMTIILIKPHQLRNLRKYKMWIHAMPDFSAETPM